MAKKDIRTVALSGRQVVAIILIIAALMLLGAAIAHYNGQPAEIAAIRMKFWIAFSCCAVASLILFLWHHRIVSQPDIHPDILAQLFGEDRVAELDTLHFWANGRQIGPQARLIILLQNVYADRCSGRLQLNPVGTTPRIPQANLPMEFELGAAEVIALWRDMPIPVPHTAEISFGIEGFIRKVRAPRIRFKRRTAIRPQTPAPLLVAGALAGHIHYSSGSRLNIPLQPAPPDANSPTAPTAWQTLSLWSPENPNDPAAVYKLLNQLFN